MPPIKAIFLDLDDTLIDDDASYARSIENIGQDFPQIEIERLRQAYDDISPNFWAAGDLPALRSNLWRTALVASGHDPSLAEAIRDCYLRHRIQTAVALPRVAEVLDSLAGRYRLAVITNGGGDIQPQRLRHTGLERYFELTVASTDVNAGKPNAVIFQHALDKLGTEAAAAWHVGDSLHSDVAGALNAGLGAAVWLNRTGAQRDASHPTPHHEITSLAELPSLLG